MLKLHEMSPIPECKYQQQITFTPHPFQLDGVDFKNTMKKVFQGAEKLWNNFIKPGFKIPNPIISAGVAAKTEKPSRH